MTADEEPTATDGTAASAARHERIARLVRDGGEGAAGEEAAPGGGRVPAEELEEVRAAALAVERADAAVERAREMQTRAVGIRDYLAARLWARHGLADGDTILPDGTVARAAGPQAIEESPGRS